MPIEIVDAGTSFGSRRKLAAKRTEIIDPKDSLARIQASHGGSGPNDVKSIAVDQPPNHILAQVDPVTGKTVSSTTWQDGTSRTSIPLGMNDRPLISKPRK